MTIWFALFLGLIQGLTEFLPVSSSGHLAIFQYFFGMDYQEVDHMLFTVLLHFATLMAIIIFYWRDVKGMAADFFSLFTKKKTKSRGNHQMPPARRLLLLLVVATLPLFIFLFFSDMVEQLSANPLFVGIALLCTGVLLWFSDRVPRGHKDEKNASIFDVLCIGFMQGIATIPGLSRSGLTITTGLFRGFDRKFAVRFSFLMSIPAVLGAVVLQVVKVVGTDIDSGIIPIYLAGMAVAGVVGYLALCLIRRLVSKGFSVFAYYCLAIGAITIIAYNAMK